MPSSKDSDRVFPIRIVNANGPVEMALEELLHRLGYLEQLGIAATKTYVSNGREAVDHLVSGAADVAVQIGFGPALAAIAKGAPLRIIAGSNLLTVHAIYARDPSIRSLRDLAGKTVGIGARGALTHQLVFAALRKHGLDTDAVRFVSIGNSATIFRELCAGHVDAGFGETDVFENQARYGVHALADGVLWRELPDFTNQASFAPVATIAAQREALVRTLAAHAHLYRYIQTPESREPYAQARAAALPDADASETSAQWRFYQAHKPYAVDLALSEARVRYMQEINVAMGLQDRVLPYHDVTDMSLAAEARQLAV